MGALLGKVDLPGLDGSVHVARAYVRSVLRQAGGRVLDDELLDDVETLVSEVFTNAVRHSRSGHRPGGMVHIRVHDDGGTVRVEVTDEGSPVDLPVIPERVDPLGESGRGLWLVRELSTAWGWRSHDRGRTIWFEARS
ncbi:ATP-binding protein [Sphaerisporangium rufum]|nr:ATP-binding protein [Sphaerisporangium rufum]